MAEQLDTESPIAVGVDGARGGWLAACLHADAARRSSATRWRTTLHLVEQVESVAGLRQDARSPVAIDVPIGLLDAVDFRVCDQQARERLPGYKSSVFAPPARYMLKAAGDYPALRSLVADLRKTFPDAKGISAQSAGIAPKVAEVDAYVRATPDTEDWMFECHPELSFAALNGGPPLGMNKHSAGGVVQRLRLLREHFPDVETQIAAAPWPSKRVAISDVLDAYAALATAVRCALGEQELLGDGERDSAGILMRMAV